MFQTGRPKKIGPEHHTVLREIATAKPLASTSEIVAAFARRTRTGCTATRLPMRSLKPGSHGFSDCVPPRRNRPKWSLIHRPVTATALF